MIKTFNYAKFYESQRLASYESLQKIFKVQIHGNYLQKVHAVAEAEPMQKKIEEEQKLKRLEEVDEGIDREEFNCEISDHIYERNRVEAILVKEKVKEIQKVIVELDKKIQNAKILETFAVHSKEESMAEYQEQIAKIQKIKDQQKI